MRNLTYLELENLSFPDAKVLEMNVDFENRYARIETDRAYLDLLGGEKLKNCKVTVKNWESIKVALYRAKTHSWENLNLKIEKLDDICEFEFKSNNVKIFRGFGSESGQWIEIMFTGGILECECD